MYNDALGLRNVLDMRDILCTSRLTGTTVPTLYNHPPSASMTASCRMQISNKTTQPVHLLHLLHLLQPSKLNLNLPQRHQHPDLMPRGCPRLIPYHRHTTQTHASAVLKSSFNAAFATVQAD